MDLDYGHGFIPRIGSSNYKAVDRCLGQTDLFDGALHMPWAILDAPWAAKNQDFVGSLRSHDTKVLLDGAWWRYRYSPTFQVKTMASASWAPDRPLTSVTDEELACAVRNFLRAQAKLEPSAYLIPGFMPDDKYEDLRRIYDVILAVAGNFDEIAPKPLVLFLGAHSEGLPSALRLLENLPGFLSGLYVQVSPTHPLRDSPSKLLKVTQLLLAAERLNLAVIAGHAGAISPALRAAGIDAADAGLASSETFESSSARRPRPPREEGSEQSGGPSSRIYLGPLGLSLNAKRVRELRSVPAVRDLISGCRLTCHRFIGGEDFVSRAREHSLRTRIEEAEAMAKLPSSMRLSEMIEGVTRRRSTVTAVNAALVAKGMEPLDTRPADNHLNWLNRMFERRPAA
jgi:hypothetical protein